VLIRALILSVLAVLVVPRDAGAAWQWPVRGEVITPFALQANPFARGQHRGIDIAARPAGAVLAPCTGAVTFAGRVPGRGRGVTIACGRLVATVLELGRVFLAKGDRALAGDSLGTAAASHVQLGARRAGERHGYLDPQSLLRGDTTAPPPLLAPPSGRPERRSPRPADPPVPVETAAPAPAPGADGLPAVAWAGLGLLVAGTPLGAWHRRRRPARPRSARPSAARG
jgi:hypothetical protein